MTSRLVVAVLTVLVVAAVPAHAEDVATGTLMLDGSAHLPMAACEPAEPDGACEGTWAGTLTGTLDGRHTSADGQEVPWSVLVEAPGTATLHYAPPDDTLACAAGPVEGQVTFSGRAFGPYGNAVLVPAPIIGSEVSMSFVWLRGGTTGPLIVTDLTVRLEVHGVGWVTVVDESADVSVAAGVATVSADDPFDCVTQIPAVLDGALTATLSGIAVAAD